MTVKVVRNIDGSLPNSVLINHHMGLGDHIVCNGLVRQLISRHTECDIYLMCYPHNEISVSAMYSDLDIKLLTGDPSNEHLLVNFAFSKYSNFSKVYEIGYSKLNLSDSVNNIERQFYNIAGVDFKHKYESSKFPYLDRVEDYSNYIFIHDDPSRNQHVNIKTNSKIYRPMRQYDNILDYIPIMKTCKEIHVMESSFMHLIECIPEINENLYLHRIRHYPIAETPFLMKNWNYV